LHLTQFLPRKLTFYGSVSKPIACVTLVRKAADEIRITIFFESFGVKKINELVVTSNKLTNNFAVLVTSVLGPRVGPRWSRGMWYAPDFYSKCSSTEVQCISVKQILLFTEMLLKSTLIIRPS
jgi:hypothetical protein